jgi:predicted nucleotidyltransferase
MHILERLKESISKVGIKEVARRSGLSPSTVSRVGSGIISPSFEVVEKISDATGFCLELHPESKITKAPRLAFAKNILGLLRNELRALGVRHAIIFGSVARGEDKSNSDVDIYLEYKDPKPKVAQLLKAEGRVIEAFGETKVDVLSRIDSVKGQRLKMQIDKDGICVF